MNILNNLKKVTNIHANSGNNATSEVPLLPVAPRGKPNYTINEGKLRKVLGQLHHLLPQSHPNFHLKEVLNCLTCDLLVVVNSSLETGTFPDALKTALIRF